MQRLQIVVTAILLFTGTALGQSYSFTEPPVDSPDYTRTYALGQTVFVTWNYTASIWPLVHLRLDPLSATDAFEYGVTYATLINNATNTGSFEWTIGENDNITLDLIEKDPRMFFQLNDATGADTFTLDSRAFLVLGSSENSSATNTPPSPTPTPSPTSSTATSTHTTSSSTVSASPAPPAHGLSQAGKVGVGIGIPFVVLCLGLLAFIAFQLRRKNSNIGGSGIPEYRSELENSQGQRNTMLSYRSGQTEPVLPYGQGPRQELPEK